MTRTRLFSILAVIAIAIGVIAVISRSRGRNTESSSSRIETVGLAEYGLEIIDAGRSAFKKLMAEKKPGPENPFSVFVVNNSEQAIASCTLTWEILLPDGTTDTYYKTKTGTLEAVSDDGAPRLAESIPARGSLLFSVSDASDDQAGTGTGIGFRTGGGHTTIIQQLSDSVKVKVSIDGVLFVDGTYGGADTKNCFERFKGWTEANRELNSEIAQLVNDGAEPDAIASHLETIARTNASDVQMPAGQHPQYAFGKWMQKSSYARLLLLIREKKGDQAVLDRVRTESSKPQIELRRLEKG